MGLINQVSPLNKKQALQFTKLIYYTDFIYLMILDDLLIVFKGLHCFNKTFAVDL